MRAGLVLAVWVSSVVVGASGEQRLWVDAASGREVEARAVEVDGAWVVLRTGEGELVRVARGRLSGADQAWLAAAGLPGGQAWPRAVATARRVGVEELGQEGGWWRYGSEHFEFALDAEVSRSVIEDWARVFEASYGLMRALPLGMELGLGEGERFRAAFFRERGDFLRAGGLEGSAGIYVMEQGRFMAPFESMGLEEFGGRLTKGRDYDSHVLRHEVTHQVMNDWLLLVPFWLNEGLAEYAASVPYAEGGFDLGAGAVRSALRSALAEFGRSATAYGARGEALAMMPLEELMAVDSSGFARDYAGDLVGARRLYLSALCLTYYHIHLADGGEPWRLCAYLRDLGGDAAVMGEARRRGERRLRRDQMSPFLRELTGRGGWDTGLVAARARRDLMGGRTMEEYEREVMAALGGQGLRW